MSDLLSKIKLGTDNVKLVDWPGTQTKVALKILSQSDLQSATFDTDRLFKTEKIEVSMVNASTYDDEKAVQILYRALRDPAKMTEPVCSTIIEFRKALTRSERDILIDEYLTFEKDVNPASEALSDGELDKVVSEIKKKPEMINGSNYSTASLKKLITILASPAQNLPQVSG